MRSLRPTGWNLVNEFGEACFFKQLGLDKAAKPVHHKNLGLDQFRLVATVKLHPFPGGVAHPEILVEPGVNPGHLGVEFAATDTIWPFGDGPKIDYGRVYILESLLIYVGEIHCITDGRVLLTEIDHPVKFAEFVFKRFHEESCNIVIRLHRFRRIEDAVPNPFVVAFNGAGAAGIEKAQSRMRQFSQRDIYPVYVLLGIMYFTRPFEEFVHVFRHAIRQIRLGKQILAVEQGSHDLSLWQGPDVGMFFSGCPVPFLYIWTGHAIRAFPSDHFPALGRYAVFEFAGITLAFPQLGQILGQGHEMAVFNVCAGGFLKIFVQCG